MSLNYFDLIISIIVLFLGLKGIINGFFKELFGLLGIVGGIFLASRVGDVVGQKLSDLIFKFENTSAISFTGFLFTLALFWFLMITLGLIFKKLSSMSGLGILDKLLGFVFSSGKFFLIVAVISYATYNIQAIRGSMDSISKNSFMFPILVEAGSFIMKLDPIEITDEINETIDKGKEIIQENVNSTINNSAAELLDATKIKLKPNEEEISSNKANN